MLELISSVWHASFLTFVGVSFIPLLLFIRRHRLAKVDGGFYLIVVGLTVISIGTFLDYLMTVIISMELQSSITPSLWENGATILALLFLFPGTIMTGFGLSTWLPALQHLDREIERRRTAERKLVEAMKAAEMANRAKSEFLANMSHELRTPLNSIIGFSEIIRDQLFGKNDLRYSDYASEINVSGHHLLEIISDILDISKIESGKSTVDDTEVEIQNVVNASIMMLAVRANEARVSLKNNIPETIPLLRADVRHMKQIIINLISNAIKFTPTNGEISIGCQVLEGGALEVTVRDDGIGIEEADIPSILLPFGQVEASLNREHGGTGLGLPICVALMELHGGKLSIESEINKGTLITLNFPAERTIMSGKSKK